MPPPSDGPRFPPDPADQSSDGYGDWFRPSPGEPPGYGSQPPAAGQQGWSYQEPAGYGGGYPPGYAQPGYDQPGYPQPGYAQPGYPQQPPPPYQGQSAYAQQAPPAEAPRPVFGGYAGLGNSGPDPGQGSGDPTITTPAKNKMATAALVAWIIPVAGLVVGIAGYAKSRTTGVGAARALIGIALSVAVLAGGVFLTPKLLKAFDPGCDYFKGTALNSYNQMIGDLNKQASQSKLSSDIQTTISQLMTAETRAKSSAVENSLSSLLTQLSTIRTDVSDGSVPGGVVQSLNSAAQAADNACGTL